MKVVIRTKTALSQVGWIGAALLIGAPFLSAIAIIQSLDTIMRNLRYDPSAEPWNSTLLWIPVAGGLAMMVGLVLVLVGREYSHNVEIITTERT